MLKREADNTVAHRFSIWWRGHRDSVRCTQHDERKAAKQRISIQSDCRWSCASVSNSISLLIMTTQETKRANRRPNCEKPAVLVDSVRPLFMPNLPVSTI